MQGSKIVKRELNKVLAVSLIAINQYFLHARMLKNWGVEALGKSIYKQSIEEMKMSDDIIERVLLLEGLPNLQDLGKLLLGENVKEILECDLQLEQNKHAILIEAIKACEAESDFVSRELLRKLKDENEEHTDWLETQLKLIEEIGLENFVQQAIGESD
ncbi:bacterioferritin [Vitreoscilla massiliensis]|uniref:Bacterioferritin n=1 Tax=Vitreoscilla massiliensis TaxID=1689272 RepID=A0ABY4DX83_9NEIS|nr:bacterioferritin [Vitreoscilla massiliensis]UOO88135.1 bacterioferritin [Vitreoscilla massiliensis]